MSEDQAASQGRTWRAAAREYVWFSVLLLLFVAFLGTAPRL
jgi:hypothetical protein